MRVTNQGEERSRRNRAVEPQTIDDPRIRLFHGVFKSAEDGSGAELRGAFDSHWSIRVVFAPMFVLIALASLATTWFVLSEAHPSVLGAALLLAFSTVWILAAASLFSPRLWLDTPTRIEAATRDWLRTTLASERPGRVDSP